MSQHGFSFAGLLSKDKHCPQDVEGINGETCWLMIQDEFSKMVHCNVRISKAPPVQFIDAFLTTCAPVEATQKFVVLDQGGELCSSLQMSKIFKKHNCTVMPTGPDASNQNPVEQHCQTISNAVRAVLISANLPIKFLPHWSLHPI